MRVTVGLKIAQLKASGTTLKFRNARTPLVCTSSVLFVRRYIAELRCRDTRVGIEPA